jgi:hypothetical protein
MPQLMDPPTSPTDSCWPLSPFWMTCNPPARRGGCEQGGWCQLVDQSCSIHLPHARMACGHQTIARQQGMKLRRVVKHVLVRSQRLRIAEQGGAEERLAGKAGRALCAVQPQQQDPGHVAQQSNERFAGHALSKRTRHPISRVTGRVTQTADSSTVRHCMQSACVAGPAPGILAVATTRPRNCRAAHAPQPEQGSRPLL